MYFDINKQFARSFDFSKSLIYFSAKPSLSTDFEKIFYFLRWTFGKAPYSFQNKFCPPRFSKIFSVSGGHFLHSRICFSSAFVHRILKIFFDREATLPRYYYRDILFCPPLWQTNLMAHFAYNISLGKSSCPPRGCDILI